VIEDIHPATDTLLDGLCRIAIRAAAAIRAIAPAALKVRAKDDHSPVTAADETSESIILEGLLELLPGVPVVSEEAVGHAAPRALARQFGLTIADKHDSQDICFVPSGHYADMIERLRPGAAEAGEIVDLDGRVLGTHNGIIHFTVGQRRGLGLAVGSPLYVVRLDARQRRVVVGPREALRMSRIVLRDVNWIGDGSVEEELADDRREIFVKVRSTRPPQAGWLCAANGGYEVELADGEHGVSPGQACVFYDAADGQARVLGGGFIRHAAAARASASDRPLAQAAAR